MARKLDAREERFVSEYLVDLDPKRAAVAAGYSESMASTKAFQWVSGSKSTKPHVMEAIRAAQQRRAQKLEITADRVIEELALIAFADVGDVVTGGGGQHLELRALEKLEPKVRRAIESVGEKMGPNGASFTLRMHSKTTALKMLVDHFGLSAPIKLQVGQGITALLDALQGRMSKDAYEQLVEAVAALGDAEGLG